MRSRLNNDRENFAGTLSFHTICSLMLISTFSLRLLSWSPLQIVSPACVTFRARGMLRVFSGSCKNDVGGRCSVVFRAGHGWIRACTCTVGFQYLTLAPDFHSVSTGVYRESAEGVRGKWFMQGLNRDVYDWMFQRLCSTLSWQWVFDMFDAQLKIY